jgi:hypothetical protein
MDWEVMLARRESGGLRIQRKKVGKLRKMKEGHGVARG